MEPLPVLNRGFGGSVFPQATHYLDRTLIPYEPRAVVVYEGDNDIYSGTTPDCVLRDLEAFIEAARQEQADLPVYVLAVKPSISRASLWPQMEQANAYFAALADRDADLIFIDVASPMFLEDGALNEALFVDDGLHMNADGYAVWTSIVQPILADDLD